MPVVDCKPIGQDCDDDHHSKLVDRQGKNNNDTSPVFSNVPIGSAVEVQHEESGPWTYGTVVNMATTTIMTGHILFSSQDMADAFQETDGT